MDVLLIWRPRSRSISRALAQYPLGPLFGRDASVSGRQISRTFFFATVYSS